MLEKFQCILENKEAIEIKFGAEDARHRISVGTFSIRGLTFKCPGSVELHLRFKTIACSTEQRTDWNRRGSTVIDSEDLSIFARAT